MRVRVIIKTSVPLGAYGIINAHCEVVVRTSRNGESQEKEGKREGNNHDALHRRRSAMESKYYGKEEGRKDRPGRW